MVVLTGNDLLPTALQNCHERYDQQESFSVGLFAEGSSPACTERQIELHLSSDLEQLHRCFGMVRIVFGRM
jgi:hypothetical protein